jgi:fructokinase
VRIGIDVGGTKIEGIVLDDAGGILIRRRIPAPRGDYAATIRTVVSLIHDIEADLGATGTIGVGIPGTVSRTTGRVKNANSTWLNGQPLARDLETTLSRAIRIANDANCFALSEAVDGAGQAAHVVFGVILGTGTGGGVVVGGSVVDGPNGIAGEWGHNPMPWPRAEEWPGPACYCGRTGCIECFLSGPGLALDYASADASVEAEEIARRARQGEPIAMACLERYEERLARALASIINVLDPDVIVLGGGLSNIDRWYDRVPKLWGKYVFSDSVLTRLVRAKHGDSSGVRGAAWLWDKKGLQGS